MGLWQKTFFILCFKGIERFCPITVRRKGGMCTRPKGSCVVPDHLEASGCPPIKGSSAPLLEATLLSWSTLTMWVQSLSIITSDPLECVVAGVYICRDPALCLYFVFSCNFAVFRTFLSVSLPLTLPPAVTPLPLLPRGSVLPWLTM